MDIIDKLHNVRQTGKGRWIACCPAHDDKSPSLSIRQCDDGALLLHCFAGCDIHSIVDALAIDIEDLFPKTDQQHRPRERRPFIPMDVLRASLTESQVVLIACHDILNGAALTDADFKRLQTAHERLQQAVRIAEGR